VRCADMVRATHAFRAAEGVELVSVRRWMFLVTHDFSCPSRAVCVLGWAVPWCVCPESNRARTVHALSVPPCDRFQSVRPCVLQWPLGVAQQFADRILNQGIFARDIWSQKGRKA